MTLSSQLLRPARASGILRGARVREVSGVPRPTAAPSAQARRREVAALAQLPRLVLATPWLLRAPRAVGSPVVVDVPGWLAPESSAAPLRAYLRTLGYDARGWGLGVNRGDVESDTERLAERVVAWADQHGPVSLVGWSLGGVLSREVARRHPESVAQVITYGTPVVGGPTYTLGAGHYGPEESARIAALTEQHDRENPIQVPVTAIFTRRDGVVAWEACLDHVTPDVEHLEVRSTHVGLGFDPDVWGVIAERLARR